MNTVFLSLITITKNDSWGMTRALKSTEVWRSLPGVELIVVDGGDQNWDNSDRSIKVLRQRSTGIAGAFNEGLEHARGDWVWFVNGGDAIHEDLDPLWLEALLKKTRAEIVTGALHYDGEALPKFAPPLRLQWPLITSWLPHPSTLVRRETLERNGGFDSRWKIGMDFDLWYRLLSGPAVVDVVAIPFARFDGSGVSRRSENKSRLLCENTAILWKYKTLILRTWWRKGWLLLSVFLQAAKNRWF